MYVHLYNDTPRYLGIKRQTMVGFCLCFTILYSKQWCCQKYKSYNCFSSFSCRFERPTLLNIIEQPYRWRYTRELALSQWMKKSQLATLNAITVDG